MKGENHGRIPQHPGLTDEHVQEGHDLMEHAEAEAHLTEDAPSPKNTTMTSPEGASPEGSSGPRKRSSISSKFDTIKQEIKQTLNKYTK